MTVITAADKRIFRLSPGFEIEPVQAGDIKRVISLLQNPEPPDYSVLSRKEKKLFQEVLTPKTRVSIALPECESLYGGSWYRQGPDECVTWSVINAMHALSVEPNPSYLLELLTLTCSNKKTKQPGLNPQTAKELLEIKYKNEQIEINLAPAESQLKATANFDLIAGFPVCTPRFLDLPYDSPDLIRAAENKEAELKQISELITANANNIKNLITANRKLVILVSNQEYNSYRPAKDCSHAICITGYRIDKNGFMDLQIIDPEVGIIWASLEHISSCLSSAKYTVSKK